MLLTLGCQLAQAEEQAAFDAFFRQFASNRDAITSLHAPFTQKTITPDEIVTSIGTVTYARPKRLIFRYDDPKQVYLLDGARAYEYDAELLQVQIFDLDDSPQASAFYLGFEDDAAALMEANDIRLLLDEDTGKVAIELTPKPVEDSESFFERATLHLRKGDYLPEEIHIVNDEESETRITLGEIQLNTPLGPAELQIDLPEGTDIIENDEYIETVGKGGKRIPAPRPEEVATP
jgi:outer membrane lipoprotein-sorting protein